AAATEPVEAATAVLATPPPTAFLQTPPARSSAVRRRRGYLLPGAAALIVLALLLLFLLTPGQSAPTHGSGTSRTTAVHHAKTVRDPLATTIRQLAASLAGGGWPGDGPLAASLDATAAAKPGAARETAAQSTLTLA